jgi:hypothetical protein
MPRTHWDCGAYEFAQRMRRRNVRQLNANPPLDSTMAATVVCASFEIKEVRAICDNSAH